ncbi:MAG: chromosomal replication initiation protein, partial [Chlamydiia bacterium]|nr:chromosomal replication initiation protein [Chlamydiia bacterium]
MREWETFLAKLKEDYGEEVFQKWLHPLTVERFDARNLYLKAEDPFQAKWFEEHIRPRLKR